MKRAKTIFVIIVASVIVQVTVLAILDRYYLVDNFNFQVTYLEGEKSKETDNKLRNLESKNKNYTISYDENLIKIYDKRKDSENYIRPEEGNKFENVKLSENGNEILIDEHEKNSEEAKSYSYNIENKTKK